MTYGSAFQAETMDNVAKTLASLVGPEQISAGCACSAAPLLEDWPRYCTANMQYKKKHAEGANFMQPTAPVFRRLLDG